MTFSNGENSREIGSEELVDLLCIDSLQRNVKHYGLEGLCEAIERVYTHNPEIKERMLSIYHRMYKI